MNADKERLLNDLLGNTDADSRRESILTAGGQMLRRRRRRRQTARFLAAVSTVLLLGILWQNNWKEIPGRTTEVQPPAVQQKPHELSDEELLDLFPDTPVGLATVNGKTRLLFLRPGDEERLMTPF